MNPEDSDADAEWAKDPDKVYEDALSRYGIIGIELAEALREEAIWLANESGPETEAISGQTDADEAAAEEEVAEGLWGFWMRTYGHLSLLPYIFYKYLPPGLSEDINDPAASIAAFREYVFHRYEVIVDVEWLKKKYSDGC